MFSYTKGDYKYRLSEEYQIRISIFGYSIDTQWYSLDENGLLILKAGYAWNGASGPTIDTEDTQLPSAVHDCLYQIMQLGQIEYSHKVYADRLFYTLILSEIDRLVDEEKLNAYWKKPLEIRAYLWYKAVSWFGAIWMYFGKRNGR